MRPAVVMLMACACAVGSGCDLAPVPPLEDKRVHDGDAAQGRTLVADGRFGCTACHSVPGVASPRGVVGPPLHGMASRSFIAGQLANKPEVMVAFLRDPPALVAGTGMPNVGLTAAQARDIAAWLYTLENADAAH